VRRHPLRKTDRRARFAAETRNSIEVVTTTRDVINAPQSEVTVTKWNLAPPVDDALLTYEAPSRAAAPGRR
jgi:hypothetical protein